MGAMHGCKKTRYVSFLDVACGLSAATLSTETTSLLPRTTADVSIVLGFDSIVTWD